MKSNRSIVLASKGNKVLKGGGGLAFDPLKTGTLAKDLDIANFLPEKVFMNKSLELQKEVERRLAGFHREEGNVRLGKELTVAERLLTQFKAIDDLHEKEMLLEYKQLSAASNAAESIIVTDDIAQIVSKNDKLTMLALEGETEFNPDITEDLPPADVIDYLPGTSLFFGASIALQVINDK
jgi:hypothetical protein